MRLGRVRETVDAWPHVEPEMQLVDEDEDKEFLELEQELFGRPSVPQQQPVVTFFIPPTTNPPSPSDLESTAGKVKCLAQGFQEHIMLNSPSISTSISTPMTLPPLPPPPPPPVVRTQHSIQHSMHPSGHHPLQLSQQSSHASAPQSQHFFSAIPSQLTRTPSSPSLPTPMVTSPTIDSSTPMTPIQPPTHILPTSSHSYAPVTLTHFNDHPKPDPPNMISPSIYRLSSAGFVYSYPSSPSTPSTPSSQSSNPSTPSTPDTPNSPLPSTPIPTPPMAPVFKFLTSSTSSTMKPVSPAIASRQEKLEKYRQKRTKRSYSRPIDQARRERASLRQRDEFGHFILEKKLSPGGDDVLDVRNQLEMSKRESQELREKLTLVLQELIQVRQRADEASEAQEIMRRELEQQQQLNQALAQENHLLWSTVPTNEIFSTIVPQNNYVNVNAFKEKIDLSHVELNWTNSPHRTGSKQNLHLPPSDKRGRPLGH